jgi:tripartite-type tricarboxylate transporter receptor subunit TctC
MIRFPFREVLMNRFRVVLSLLLCAAATAIGPVALAADPYPSRPVKLVVPYPPGGSADLIGRMVADKMTKSMGQPVVVENKGGASGAIGSEFVAHAQPDGYTLGIAIADTHAINPAVNPKLPYDAQKDFVPISLLATQPFVLAVGPNVKAQTLAEFVAAARQNPGKLTYASNGAGGLQHLAMELFAKQAGIKALHVPYKGAAPALSDVIGGQVDAIFISLQGAGGNLGGGKLRALAITSAKRLAVAPDIPTFAESGYPKFQMAQWYGLLAPKGTPADIVQKLNGEANAAMTSTDVADKLRAAGTEPVGSSAEQFRAFLAAEIAQWATVAREGNIQIE